jgi:succinyl-diaminopimelate desuccinylase
MTQDRLALEEETIRICQELIRIPSVNYGEGKGDEKAVAAYVVESLAEVGITATSYESAPNRVNVVAKIKGRDSSRAGLVVHGHIDVVPAEAKDWSVDPFSGEIKDGFIWGRGAVDMKGSIAAFVAALHDIPKDAGTISLIITGDEEGPAIHGTRALITHMQAQGSIPDYCLVGEPTSVNRLGDMMKIGRRGSVNMWISVAGTQGHVAYPHLADNPIPRLIAILAEIEAITLDEGTDWFQASNIEITDLIVGNKATNVIPAKAEARLSIRFNDLQNGDALVLRLRALVERHGGSLTAMISGEAFLTPPGAFSAAIAEAVEAVVGIAPEASTTGGTSDARFLTKICPVVEFGLCNATMHKLDEAVAIADLNALTEIYRRVALKMLAA